MTFRKTFLPRDKNVSYQHVCLFFLNKQSNSTIYYKYFSLIVACSNGLVCFIDSDSHIYTCKTQVEPAAARCERDPSLLLTETLRTPYSPLSFSVKDGLC